MCHVLGQTDEDCSWTLYSSLIIICIRMSMYLPCITLLTKTCLCIQSLQNSSFNHFSAIYCLLLERVMKRQSLQQNKLGTEWLKVPGQNPSAVLPLEDDLSTLVYTCSASATCQLQTTGYQESQPGDLKKDEEKDNQSIINPSVGSRKSQRQTPSDACASQNFSCLPSKG